MKGLVLLLLVQICLGARKYPDYKDHACKRECTAGGRPEKCYYKLHFDKYTTMQADCTNCLSGNQTACEHEDCMPGDGTRRFVYVYNGILPGPSIEVCENDEVIVDLVNEHVSDTTTIHFHGMHMRKTVFMDGVPWITQCPILPGTTFRYHFRAAPKGTHMYHSHTGTQRADGAYGHLVVRQSRRYNPLRDLYDEDKSEHTVSFVDWLDSMTEDHQYTWWRNKEFYEEHLRTILINGYGPNSNSTLLPKKFLVDQGKRYRFRFIHAGNSNCPISITIDNHNLRVISTDGNDINYIDVSKLTLTNGERYDVVIDANQMRDSYLIRVVGNCNTNSYAIIQYSGTENKILQYDGKLYMEGKTSLNCVNVMDKTDCINYDKMRSLEPMRKSFEMEPDYQFFLGYDTIFYAPAKLRGVNDDNLCVPFVNNISFVNAPIPMIFDRETKLNYCDPLHRKNCDGDQCHCTYSIRAKRDALVEIIFVDEGTVTNLSHPWHLHGNNFRILSQEKLGTTVNLEYVKNQDRLGRLKRNFINPPIKDVVVVPDGGYAIIRFIADNPGVWLLHCHIGFHSEEGMRLVFRNEGWYTIPMHFPTCGNYITNNKL